MAKFDGLPLYILEISNDRTHVHILHMPVNSHAHMLKFMPSRRCMKQTDLKRRININQSMKEKYDLPA